MEKINLNNYQAYMLDYVEGNLSEIRQAELFLFLGQYPGLKQELDEFENISVIGDELEQHNVEKEQFKKTNTPDDLLIGYIEDTLSHFQRQAFEKQLALSVELREQLRLYQLTILKADRTLVYENKHELERLTVIDEQLIGYLEKSLNEKEIEKLEQHLSKNGALKKDLQLLQCTILFADASIVFPYKEELKRKSKIVYLPQFEWKYAAIAASVLLLIGLFFMFNQEAKSVSVNGFVALNSYGKKSEGPNVLKKQEIQEPSRKNEIRQFANKALLQKDNKTKQVIEMPVVEQPLIMQSVVNDTATKNNNNVIASTNSNSVFPKVIINKEVDNGDDEIPASAAAPSNRQYLADKIKESAWGEEDKTITTSKKKLSGFDVLAAVAKKLKNLGSKKTDAKVEYNDDTESSEYTLTLGGLSVSKTKSFSE